MHCAGSQTTALWCCCLGTCQVHPPPELTEGLRAGFYQQMVYTGESFSLVLSMLTHQVDVSAEIMCSFRILLVKFRSVSSFGGPTAYGGISCMSFALLDVAGARRAVDL